MNINDFVADASAIDLSPIPLSGSAKTGFDVEVILPHHLDTGRVCVFCTYLPSGKILSSPVMLTVGKEAALSLNVTVGGGYNHTVSGKLTCDGQPVVNKQIVITVNGTAVAAVNTTADGSYTIILNLKAVNNSATLYQIETAFYGDNALNLTGLATLPNGTQYAVCTTLHYYGYKPSANATMLTVEPQTTRLAKTNKTPEQMQAEAGEWLTVWHEFSWWYPWYRMHVRMHVNPMVHLALNPILPGGELAEWDDIEFFQGLGVEFVETMVIEFLGLVGTYILAKYFSITSFVVGIALEATKIVLQGLVFLDGWDSAEAMMASGLMSAIMLLFTVTQFGSTMSNYVTIIIDEVRSICGWPLVNPLTWILTKLKDMVLWGRGAWSAVVDIMEVFADFTIMVLSLRRCCELLGIS